MRLTALVDVVLVALVAAAVSSVPPKDPHAQIAGSPRPGWPYFKHPVCRTRAYGFFGTHHVIAVSGVKDIPQTCNFLWAGLNKFDGCKLLTKTYCGGTDGYLQWRFQRWVSCNPGMIASSWFDTTENQLGFLDCEAKQPDVQPEEGGD
ncbi:uncharacterized protein ColSpa_04461 [Colletotrichum spaethianum]|uniref:Uncharacterized protein n=1 Tax=Colletotrichum spaethianum TaxID=700344 RepID=A0AA37LCW3_9PEZI|nr:uncharacterized protein ColSpa_04461 [Colletotrichum spaethianum]GKT44280.1 hypothetical protein ColSpa_04461 [Colletotrichum spaethianum]